MTKIQWTNETWNPMVGCSKVSSGCQNCYAVKDAHRMAGNPNAKVSSVYEGLTERRGDRTEWTGKVNFVPEALQIPIKTRKPTTWFVNSMSDLFHESVKMSEFMAIYEVMAQTPRHTYQILTKRPENMLRRMEGLTVLPNVWLGVTVENQKAADERIPLLLQTPAAVRFLSCEPLLEEVEIYKWLDKGFATPCPRGSRAPWLDWVIVGGESGPGARPCNVHWIRSIVEQCAAGIVPCFVKQLGSNPFLTSTEVIASVEIPKRMGVRVTGKGCRPDEWPKDLRVRQFPKVATPV